MLKPDNPYTYETVEKRVERLETQVEQIQSIVEGHVAKLREAQMKLVAISENMQRLVRSVTTEAK